MTGKYVYWSILFTITATLVWGLLLDSVLLRLDQKYTISDYLRMKPAWFWWPAGLVVAGLAALAVHLFVWPPESDS